MIIATALAMKNLENSKPFKDGWAIVTCGKGLSSLANNLAVRCINKEDFYRILERETGICRKK